MPFANGIIKKQVLGNGSINSPVLTVLVSTSKLSVFNAGLFIKGLTVCIKDVWPS
jgi:hypothetical protein